MPVGLSDLERELQRDPKSRKFFELSREYQRAGRLQEALATCESGLQNHPNMPQARVLQAQLLLASGDLKAARNAIERALLVLPDNVAANHLAAEIFWGMGEGERALKHFKIVQLFDPGREGVSDRIRALETQFQQMSQPPPLVSPAAVDAILDTGPGPAPPSPEPADASTGEKPEAPSAPPLPMAEPVPAAAPVPLELPVVLAPPAEAGPFPEPPAVTDAAAEGLGEDLLDVGEATVWGRADEVMTVAAPVAEPELPAFLAPVPVSAPPAGAGAPADVAAPAPQQGDSLSTITLARLYEQQGYPEKAVEVYQRLLIRNPDDPKILAKIHVLRSQMEQGSVEDDLVDQAEIQRAMRQRRIRALNDWLRRLREERHVS